MSLLIPNTSVDISTVKAVVTTRWEGRAYRPLVIDTLEQYYVDIALDNDADTWTLDFGDPTGNYLEMLKRDNEVRVQLFGVSNRLHYILTGISDNIDFQDGVWTLTGRDMSSLAVDSYVLPQRWAKARAWAIVEGQARYLGFPDTQLAHTKMVRKLQYVDGSESYWDFWYRLYRQEQMWLWTLATGVLVGNTLNYEHDPTYFIGDARKGDSDNIRNAVIPVIGGSFHKSTQNRFEQVVTYGTKGSTKKNSDTGFSVSIHDPTMRGWVKRPTKIMLDTKSRTANAAKRLALEELFEGKVGAVEYKITIPDPGFQIQQNRVARLYLKDIDLLGNFFVVGARTQGGPNGFIQEVRLRELEYAITRRVPDPPTKSGAGTGEPGSKGGASSLAKQIEKIGGLPNGWGDYYVKAAKKYHGVISFELFLAVLLGIGWHESGFKNLREGFFDHQHEWMPLARWMVTIGPDLFPKANTVELQYQYEKIYANDAKNPLNPYHNRTTDGNAGVGPMQLTTTNLKRAADTLYGGPISELNGGRWNPENNIMIAARTLATILHDFRAARDNDIWLAIDAYGEGEAAAKAYFDSTGHTGAYAAAMRKEVYVYPGYLTIVQEAVQVAGQTTGGDGTPGDFTNPFPDGWVPNRLDMGYDGTFKNRIVAPFDGVIHYSGVMAGWKGSLGVIIKSTVKTGLPSDVFYFTEGVKPTVKSGDKVKKGDTICKPASNPYNGIHGNIEWGLASDGKIGVQTDVYVLSGVKNRREVVLDWYAWVKKHLKVPGQPTDTSSAGYP